MSILFLSDTHLADNAWPSKPLFYDTYHILPQVINIVRHRKVKKVVLAGDIIDRKRTNSRPIKELKAFISAIKHITQDAHSVYFVQGNHDDCDPPWGTVLGATHLQDTIVSFEDGTIMTGMDAVNPLELPAALASLNKKANLLVCHQMWKEHKPFGPDPDGSLMDIPLHIKTVVSGDIHRKKLMTIHRGAPKHDLKFLSPGSTSMQDIMEDENKYVWLYENGKFKSIKLWTRHVIRLKRVVSEKQAITALEGLAVELDAYQPKASKNRFAKFIAKPIVDVQYHKDIGDFEDRVAAVVQDRAHIFPRYFTSDEEEEEFVSTVEWKSQAAEAVMQALREETQDPEVFALASELISRREKTDEKIKPLLNRYLETGSCT